MITPVYSPVGRGGRLDPLRESIGMVTLSCRVEMRNLSRKLLELLSVGVSSLKDLRNSG